MTTDRLPYSNEFRLMLSAIRVSWRPDEKKNLMAFMRQPIDWAGLVRLAAYHRVLPTVFLNLKRYVWKFVPEDTQSELKQRFLANNVQGLRAVFELSTIIRHLQKRGVPVVAFKGVTLSQLLYGDFCRRGVGDIDLLVPARASHELDDGFMEMGYERTFPPLALSRARQAIFERVSYYYSYHSSGQVVEVHFRLFRNPGLRVGLLKDLFSRSETVDINAASFPVLSLHHTVLYLMLHGAHHAWARLFWLCDIAQIVSRYKNLDWGVLFHEFKKLGLERVWHQTFFLLNQLLGVPRPMPHSSGACQSKQFPVKFVLENMVDSWPVSGRGPTFFRAHRYALGLKKDARYKLEYFLCRLLSIEDWQTVPLPDALICSYLFLRPFLWGRKMLQGREMRLP